MGNHQLFRAISQRVYFKNCMEPVRSHYRRVDRSDLPHIIRLHPAEIIYNG